MVELSVFCSSFINKSIHTHWYTHTHSHTYTHTSSWQTGTLLNTEVEQTGQALIPRLAPPCRPITRQAWSLSGAQGGGAVGGRHARIGSPPKGFWPIGPLPPPSTTKHWGRVFIQMKILWKRERGERKREGRTTGKTAAIFTLTCIKLSGVLWKHCEKHWKPTQLFFVFGSLSSSAQ